MASEDVSSSDVGDLAQLSLEELLSIQVVEAASRREQTIHDAHASVTLIDRAAIEQTGATEVAELMRRVPGAHVVRMTNNTYDVFLRNQSVFAGNRTLVLLDGRPVLDPLYAAYTPYMFLPTSPLELERIEVVRGPGSTLYGAGAVGGVVRLSSRKPIDHPGFEGNLMGGLGYLPKDGGADQGPSLVNASYGHAAYNYANEARELGVRASVGFGLMPDAGTIPLRRDSLGQSALRASLHLDYRPDDDTRAYLAVSSSQREMAHSSALDASDPMQSFGEQAVVANLERKDMVDGHLTTRAVLDATRMINQSGDGDSEAARYHALWLNDVKLLDARSVTTLGAETTYMKGTVPDLAPESLAVSFVAQQDATFLPSRALMVSGAARLESVHYEDGLGNEVVYRAINPRLSVIGKLGDEHDVRVTAASAYRLPTPLEVSAGAYANTAPEPGEPRRRLVVPNDALEPEHTNSLELGYRGDFMKRLRVELVTYVQRISDVVGADFSQGVPFVFVNQADVDQIGAEASGTFALNAESSVYGTFSARHSEREGITRRDWPTYITGLGTDNHFDNGVRLHADVSCVFDYAAETTEQLGNTPLLLNRETALPNQYDVNIRLGKLILDDHVEVYLLGRNLLGFVRDRSDLAQFAGGLAQYPVGATLLVGIQLAEN